MKSLYFITFCAGEELSRAQAGCYSSCEERRVSSLLQGLFFVDDKNFDTPVLARPSLVSLLATGRDSPLASKFTRSPGIFPSFFKKDATVLARLMERALLFSSLRFAQRTMYLAKLFLVPQDNILIGEIALLEYLDNVRDIDTALCQSF